MLFIRPALHALIHTNLNNSHNKYFVFPDRQTEYDSELGNYQKGYHNIMLMLIINGMPSHCMPDQISLGPPKCFLLPFILYLFAAIPLIPAVGRCSDVLARVRATLLWPRRLGLPRQLAQYPCCCHSAHVAQSLITFISEALCMQHTLFSITNIHRGLVTLIYPISCVSLTQIPTFMFKRTYMTQTIAKILLI